MKGTATVLSCMFICILGLQLGKLNYKPTNTISAEEVPMKPTVLTKIVRDTVKIEKTNRDTVQLTKYITKKVIRTKQVPYAVRDTVSILYIKTCEPRKGPAPDSIPRKYVIHDVVDASE